MIGILIDARFVSRKGDVMFLFFCRDGMRLCQIDLENMIKENRRFDTKTSKNTLDDKNSSELQHLDELAYWQYKDKGSRRRIADEWSSG